MWYKRLSGLSDARARIRPKCTLDPPAAAASNWAVTHNQTVPALPATPAFTKPADTAQDRADRSSGVRALLVGCCHDGRAKSLGPVSFRSDGDQGYAPSEIQERCRSRHGLCTYSWSYRRPDGVHIYKFSYIQTKFD